MATFLNYYCATRLSNDVGFWASCYETFQMMGIQFSELLFESTLSGQQGRHNLPLTTLPACREKPLMGLMCIWTYKLEKCKFISVFLYLEKRLNPAIFTLMESLLTWGFLLLFKLS